MKQNRQALNFLEDWRTNRKYDHEFLLTDLNKVDVEDVPGVYIIVTTDRTTFNYPTGGSKVIYIGMSKHLRSRLQEHLSYVNKLIDNPDYGMADDEPWVGSKYQYMYYHNAKVYTFKCLGKQEEKNLESQVMWAFYQHYRALPVGNAARSYSKI